NAILVVAKTRNQLQRAASWIQRLDRLDAAASNLRVYKVQHLQAQRLAAMVNEIFNGVSASSASEEPTSQFPPGSLADGMNSDPEDNTILSFARPDQQRVIEQAIAALDRPQEQVAIEATIAEVTLTNELRYGVQFFLKSRNLGLGQNEGSAGLFREAGQAVLSRTLPGFNLDRK